jgi:hypothetical protein
VGRHVDRYGWLQLADSLRQHPGFQPD